MKRCPQCNRVETDDALVYCNREVAIKVLPETFLIERERLARFQREAQVPATLNHPNIAVIYGRHGSAHSRDPELVRRVQRKTEEMTDRLKRVQCQ
jgi:serine/threonine protein kinase